MKCAHASVETPLSLCLSLSLYIYIYLIGVPCDCDSPTTTTMPHPTFWKSIVSWGGGDLLLLPLLLLLLLLRHDYYFYSTMIAPLDDGDHHRCHRPRYKRCHWHRHRRHRRHRGLGWTIVVSTPTTTFAKCYRSFPWRTCGCSSFRCCCIHRLLPFRCY